jgi:hypothetical protein
MIAIQRNARSGSNGLDDRDQTESVITIDRNAHRDCWMPLVEHHSGASRRDPVCPHKAQTRPK